jgi:hypothetical protein
MNVFECIRFVLLSQEVGHYIALVDVCMVYRSIRSFLHDYIKNHRL